MSDGVSEGCFTDLWARLLVEDFVHQAGNVEHWLTSLPATQRRWDADVRARKIPWHAAPSVEQGAHAAFLGIVLTSSPRLSIEAQRASEVFEDRTSLALRASMAVTQNVTHVTARWQAVAIGDTCLFHTRDGRLLRAFPLEHSKQFGNMPELVGARTPSQQIRKKQRLWGDGTGQPGDRLWVMTDALARCCLVEHEAGRNPSSASKRSLISPPACGSGGAVEGDTLPSPSGKGAGGEGQFAAWISSLRSSGNLHNDDVTLLAIFL